jgi:hypothetical protein
MTSDELQRVKKLMSEGSSPQYPKAFVSHGTQDHAFVDRFATDLRAKGVDAWFSKWEIKPGDSIRQKIEEGLEECEYFIIVLSKNSINRPWVQRELDAATVRHIGGKVRKIIPIKIEDCGDLPPTLASLCWEDFSNQPYGAALKRVLDSIFGVDVRPPLGAPSIIASAERTQPKHEFKITSIPTTKFPIYDRALGEFAKQLRSEGFDAKADLYAGPQGGQLGLIVGPNGLDSKRMPPDTAGLFFPLWELNYETNRPLVDIRKFHDIFEKRPQDWAYNRPYQGSTRETNRGQQAVFSGYIMAVSHNGKAWTYEVRDPENPGLFARADFYGSKEDAKKSAVDAVRKRCALDSRILSTEPIQWEDS